MSRVTVLVAAYNADKYLVRCMESLLGQTLTDIQIICVDDASTDSTPLIIEQYRKSDSRVVAIYQKENSGQAKARNLALLHANGEYVTMVDSDDWLSVDALERAVNLFTLYPRTGCALFELRYSDGKSLSIPYAKKVSGHVWSGQEAFRLSLDWSIHGLYVAPASLYKKFPFDDSCRLYSDDNTTRLHFLHSTEVRKCAGVYYYRVHPNQATRSVTLRRFDLIEANLSMARTLATLNQPYSVIALFESERWINLAGMHGFYQRYKKMFTPADRRGIRERLEKGYFSINFRLLPAASRCKLGYLPLGGYKLYRLQSLVYFFLRNMLKKGVMLLLSALLALPVMSKQSMEPPLKIPLYLSANFGELRSGHFHGGIDFKTQGQEGKPLYAPADGYISQVGVSAGGYGNSVYITHTNGYTTVFGHLSSFIPAVADTLRNYQYKNRVFAANISFNQEFFPVKRGHLIGYSGNTGYSFGPHLHFELRRTSDNSLLDPLPFFMSRITDTTPPRATQIRIYPQAGIGAVDGGVSDKSYSIIKGSNSSLDKVPQVWGKIGFGVSAYDYMDGTTNKYGVRSVELYADNRLLFQSLVDSFTFNHNPYIDAWTDYAEQSLNGEWYMRSHVLPGNPLSMLHADSLMGFLEVSEEREYNIRYELSDLYGNKSVYSFPVCGVKQETFVCDTLSPLYLRYGQAYIRYLGSAYLQLPSNALYDNMFLSAVSYPIVWPDSSVGRVYRLSGRPVPLKNPAILSIKPDSITLLNKDKYYICKVQNGKRTYVGGTYSHGVVSALINSLESYSIDFDTLGPSITAIDKNQWSARGKIVLNLSDNKTGITRYNCYIDDEWALFSYNTLAKRLEHDLKEQKIEAGNHTLKVEATDSRGNSTVLSVGFVINR